MRVGVCVYGCTGVIVCLQACSLTYPACNAPAPYCHLGHLAPPNFSTLSHKRHDFQKRVTTHKMCVLVFSTPPILKSSHSKRNSARYCHKRKTSSRVVHVILAGF